GSGAMFGFDRVSTFTHEVETVFEKVRSGTMEASRELIDLTLASRDIILGMLDPNTEDSVASDEEAQRIVSSLQVLSGADAALDDGSAPQEEESQHTDDEESLETTWRIRFKPTEDIFATGTNPVHLLEDLRELGDCNIIAMNDEIPRLSELDPEQFHIGWEILLTTDRGKE
ncbi:MAG: chemotaxis protein CheA, partial [Actinomycetia bacterium]|nr:chemotaxis protein CheA [Actinomycetes bacterium]